MTTKTVTLSSGAAFTIAPLTLRQARDAFSGDQSDAFTNTLRVIVASLNNAVPGAATEDGIQDVLTFPDFTELQKEILIISGLKAGEAPATE